MKLEDIYQPIADDLREVDELLRSTLSESQNAAVSAMGVELMESPGKRMRPALVFLSERAACGGKPPGPKGPAASPLRDALRRRPQANWRGGEANMSDRRELVEAAAAMELIHIASLIHDDVLDEASVRHNKPTVNNRYGGDISIVLGDYVYSMAFQLIGRKGRGEIFSCVSEAIHAMCEGELIHVCQRRNLDLSERNYIVIAEKKTGSLFAASCLAGAIIGNQPKPIQTAMKEFGMNLGVAFQIVDDCKDVVGEAAELGKEPGQDVLAGDITLPLLALSDSVGQAEREEIKKMLGSPGPKGPWRGDRGGLQRLKTMLVESDALSRTRQIVASYASGAKKRLDGFEDSAYKESLTLLVDYVTQNNF